MSNDQIAKAVGYGNNAGAWLAEGGGLMGRGTAARMNAVRGELGGYGTKMASLMADATKGNAITPELQTTADKFKALLDMLKRNGG